MSRETYFNVSFEKDESGQFSTKSHFIHFLKVAALPKGARVEIEAIAVVGEVEDYTVGHS